ncbi:MAG: hypothetical protein EBU31_00450 [Proteobacteria bacterium]|nr:hypothetical protein [Pseudomonadota bacterium]
MQPGVVREAADRIEAQAAEIRSLREQVAKMEEALIEHNCGDPTCICVACINKRDVIEAQQDKEPT